MQVNVSDAKFLRAIKSPEDAPKPPRPSVAFAGRSNVGKSSLINALLKRKGLAKTSSTPGRTQAIVYFEVAEKYYFVDLPGYGYAKVPPEVKAEWGPMVERYFGGASELRLVVLILDARREPTRDDLQMVAWLRDLEIPYLFAVTKADKLSKNQLAQQMKTIAESLNVNEADALMPFSAETGQGRVELLRAILHSLDATENGRE